MVLKFQAPVGVMALGILLQGVIVSPAMAQDKRVMVAGDSISAGFQRPSYRKPLIDELSSYGCSVDMVGDQTLNSFDYRRAVSSPDPDYVNGSNHPGFGPGDGYDVAHQAFPAITADQVANGVSSVHYTVSPISTYVSVEQPDYMLVLLGTNDMGNALITNRLDTDLQINTWANQTVADMRKIIDRSISAHSDSSSLRILVANFIPPVSAGTSASDLVLYKRAAELYTSRLESMVLDRADSRVLIVDVEKGFDPDSMTFDGVHPNAVGEQHLAGAFLPILRGAGACSNTPSVNYPSLGSTVNGSSASTETITWSANGLPVSNWRVRIGDEQSGDSSTYFDSGNLPGNANSIDVTGLPADQRNVYISLQYTSGGVTDVVISSFFSRSGGNAGNPEMRSPLPGAVLPGSSVKLEWESNDFRTTQWYVRVGTTPAPAGGNGSTEWLDSGRILDASARAVTVSGLPTNGSTIYVQLAGKSTGGNWNLQNFTYEAAGAGFPKKTLEPNNWYQIGLPYNPGNNNRVRDIFNVLPINELAVNGSLTASGGNGTWSVFSYEVSAASQQGDTYKQLGPNDRLSIGKGYWILHQESGPVTLQAPSGASAISSNISSAQRAACANPGRCYSLPVNFSVASGQAGRFLMLSYPLTNPTVSQAVRVSTSNNVGCSGDNHCSLTEAYTSDLLFDTLFVYRPEIGDNGGYENIGSGSGTFQPWDGFWTASISAAAGQNAKLVVSEPGAGS